MKRKRGAQYPHNGHERVSAWHIVRTCRGRYDNTIVAQLDYADGRRLKEGRWYRMKKGWSTKHSHPILCTQGMHACVDLLDAFLFMFQHPGRQAICRVDIAGEIKQCNNTIPKIVGKYRRINYLVNIDAVIKDTYKALTKLKLVDGIDMNIRSKRYTIRNIGRNGRYYFMNKGEVERRNKTDDVFTKIAWKHIRKKYSI